MILKWVFAQICTFQWTKFSGALEEFSITSSPVENQIDLELDFKVFFYVDSCCVGIVLDQSNWCHSGIIARFEILKMASKMTVN